MTDIFRFQKLKWRTSSLNNRFTLYISISMKPEDDIEIIYDYKIYGEDTCMFICMDDCKVYILNSSLELPYSLKPAGVLSLDAV